jgi:hypothetical protein
MCSRAVSGEKVDESDSVQNTLCSQHAISHEGSLVRFRGRGRGRGRSSSRVRSRAEGEDCKGDLIPILALS